MFCFCFLFPPLCLLQEVESRSLTLNFSLWNAEKSTFFAEIIQSTGRLQRDTWQEAGLSPLARAWFRAAIRPQAAHLLSSFGYTRSITDINTYRAPVPVACFLSYHIPPCGRQHFKGRGAPHTSHGMISDPKTRWDGKWVLMQLKSISLLCCHFTPWETEGYS